MPEQKQTQLPKEAVIGIAIAVGILLVLFVPSLLPILVVFGIGTLRTLGGKSKSDGSARRSSRSFDKSMQTILSNASELSLDGLTGKKPKQASSRREPAHFDRQQAEAARNESFPKAPIDVRLREFQNDEQQIAALLAAGIIERDEANERLARLRSDFYKNR